MSNKKLPKQPPKLPKPKLGKKPRLTPLPKATPRQRGNGYRAL